MMIPREEVGRVGVGSMREGEGEWVGWGGVG